MTFGDLTFGSIVILRTGSACRRVRQKWSCGRFVTAELSAVSNAPLHVIDDCLHASPFSHFLSQHYTVQFLSAGSEEAVSVKMMTEPICCWAPWTSRTMALQQGVEHALGMLVIYAIVTLL